MSTSTETTATSGPIASDIARAAADSVRLPAFPARTCSGVTLTRVTSRGHEGSCSGNLCRLFLRALAVKPVGGDEDTLAPVLRHHLRSRVPELAPEVRALPREVRLVALAQHPQFRFRALPVRPVH